MKTIFAETHTLPKFVDQWVDPESSWDHEAQQYIPAVETRMHSGHEARAIAHYDRKTGALVVELSTTLYERFDWHPANRKVLELHAARESALRRTIQIADDWYSEVEAAIPPERTEAELLAAYGAAQPGADERGQTVHGDPSTNASTTGDYTTEARR